jgi:dipeptidyl-peptidase III
MHFRLVLTILHGRGDQKFVPNLPSRVLGRLASASATAISLCKNVLEPMLSEPSHSLGFPSMNTQSVYYPGTPQLPKDEIAMISQYLEKHHIQWENTRIRKNFRDGKPVYNVLQASVDVDSMVNKSPIGQPNHYVRLIRGDHSAELSQVCQELTRALDYTANYGRRYFLCNISRTSRQETSKSTENRSVLGG